MTPLSTDWIACRSCVVSSWKMRAPTRPSFGYMVRGRGWRLDPNACSSGAELRGRPSPQWLDLGGRSGGKMQLAAACEGWR
jgi:hypothetical protein